MPDVAMKLVFFSVIRSKPHQTHFDVIIKKLMPISAHSAVLFILRLALTLPGEIGHKSTDAIK